MVTTRRGGQTLVSASTGGTELGNGAGAGGDQRKRGRGGTDHGDYEDQGDEEWTEQPKKKNHKTRNGSKQALLSGLPDLPLDILNDICSHLDPIDLVHLSRASKSFFKLVDDSSFKSVWIDVRERQQPPLEDLELEGLSELQYAALVFDQFCNMCGKGKIHHVDYHVRKRYCPACKKANLIPVNEHVRKIRAHPFLYECALSSLEGGTGANLSKTVYYHFPSLPPLNDELNSIQSRIDALRPEGYKSIHSKNHKALARRYQALVENGEEEDEFEDDERALRDFVLEKREHKAAVERDAKRLKAREQ
ncbi:hypothetical protein JCM16303_001069 [Sporobolomyces ruberrimus]